MALTQEDQDWIDQRFKIERAETARLLRDQLEGMETRMLTAFHSWASPVEVKIRTDRAVIRELQAAVESLTERMDKLDPPLIGGTH